MKILKKIDRSQKILLPRVERLLESLNETSRLNINRVTAQPVEQKCINKTHDTVM